MSPDKPILHSFNRAYAPSCGGHGLCTNRADQVTCPACRTCTCPSPKMDLAGKSCERCGLALPSTLTAPASPPAAPKAPRRASGQVVVRMTRRQAEALSRAAGNLLDPGMDGEQFLGKQTFRAATTAREKLDAAAQLAKVRR